MQKGEKSRPKDKERGGGCSGMKEKGLAFEGGKVVEPREKTEVFLRVYSFAKCGTRKGSKESYRERTNGEKRGEGRHWRILLL